jgi:ATP/maltotriose-dependent transcriptional regulator MalT
MTYDDLKGSLTAGNVCAFVVAGGMLGQQRGDFGALSISTFTVRSYVRSILSKLNFTNRTQAAMYAVEMGLANHPLR